MPRTDGDSWDLASSVGATATMVATSRALASRGPDPLLDDPFAEPLVRAVGLTPFVRIIDGELSLEDDPVLNRKTRDRADGCAHKVFRRLLHRRRRGRRPAGRDPGVGTGHPGLPAAMAGDGTVVYEIDQPEVIEFKTRTLADLGAAPTAERRTVAIDLRDDWPAALRAGFRRRSADRVERRRIIALPAARRPGPIVRQHHRAQRTGQPAGHRAHLRPGRLLRGMRAAHQRAVAPRRFRPQRGRSVLSRRTQHRRSTTSPATAGR